MKILKRNQIIISVIALMLITVGYMNYTSNINATLETGKLMDAEQFAGIGDAKLVNSNNVVEIEENKESDNNKFSNNENNTVASGISTDTQNNNETQSTSSDTYEAEYFISSRLERDKMYSQMIETYQGMLNNGTVSSEQKNMYSQEITNINNKKNSIMIAENLIKNLGFDDVVIFVNESSVSVIVKTDNLEEANIAQIQNIVCREIGVAAENVHISQIFL